MIGHAKIGRVIEHVVDAPTQPYRQRLNEVCELCVDYALEVEALHAR